MEEQIVKFDGYSLSRLEVVAMTDSNSEKPGTVEFELTPLQSQQDENAYKIILKITCIEPRKKILVEVEGRFIFSENFDEKDIASFLRVNGPTVIYPYCRTLISTITSFDTDKSIILPIINFAELGNE